MAGVFNKTITPLALVGYEMIISNARSWKYCLKFLWSLSKALINCLQKGAILLRIKVAVGLTGLTFIIDTVHFKVKDQCYLNYLKWFASINYPLLKPSQLVNSVNKAQQE